MQLGNIRIMVRAKLFYFWQYLLFSGLVDKTGIFVFRFNLKKNGEN